MGGGEHLGGVAPDVDGGARVSVIVPWFDTGCEYRERARRWVVGRLIVAHPDWEVVHGLGGSPWVKAAAVENGLQIASGDVVVVHDADVHIPPEGLRAAVSLIEARPWVVPHLNVNRLSAAGTDRVYAGEDPAWVGDYDQPPYHGWVGGGVVVLRRGDYWRAPMDRRFVGWGQEDACWAHALETLVGPHCRLQWPLFHLWHPPAERMNRKVGSPVSEELWRRYRRARGRPDRMRQLVDEGRC